MNILNRNEIRGTREFSHKLITILPLHTPALRAKEMINILEICYDNNLNADRLINYFIIPKIEKSVNKFSFENYLYLLKVLAKMKYQEDPIFWSDYVMPSVFNFEMNFSEAKKLWEAYLNVKINCPSLELAKYFILIEDILNKFEILTQKSQDINLIRLSIDKDYSLIPKKIENSISKIKIKKLQSRLSEKEGKENVLRDLGINTETNKLEGSLNSVEGSLNRILEIKDWKKAKYDFNQADLKKMREMGKRVDEADINNISTGTIGVNGAVNLENVETKIEVVENVVKADVNNNATANVNVNADKDNDNQLVDNIKNKEKLNEKKKK